MNFFDTILLQLESFRARVNINPYVFAFLVLLLGFLVEVLINSYIQQQTYLILVISLALAAWYGGFFPCIIITIVGFLLVDYFILPPVHTFFANPAEYVRGAIFLIEGLFFGVVGESRIKREKELDRAYRAEQKAHKEADEANRIRDDFISMAAHELKTPITSQKLYIQSLEKKLAVEKNIEERKYLQVISNQTTKMTKIINDLLNVAKIRAGGLSMDFTTFNFFGWLNEVVEEFRPLYSTHKVLVKGHSTKSVHADKEKLSEVLVNLLSNAIKYSPQAKKVLVHVTGQGKNIIVSVTDYGIGMSNEDQKKLFTKYFRAEGKNEKKYKGFGMGLFIVAEIIKLHKGKIWVKSTKGKGSTFSFSLPAVN